MQSAQPITLTLEQDAETPFTSLEELVDMPASGEQTACRKPDVDAMITWMLAQETFHIGDLYRRFGSGCPPILFKAKFYQAARDRLRMEHRIVLAPVRGKAGWLVKADWQKAANKGDRYFRAAIKKAVRGVDATRVAAMDAPLENRGALERKSQKRGELLAAEIQVRRLRQMGELPSLPTKPQGVPR